MQRELKDLNDSFDAEAYKQGLLKKAGITQNDLFTVWRQHPDPDAFIQSAEVRAFKEVILEHSEELMQVVNVVDECESGEADRRLQEEGEESDGEEGEETKRRGIGRWVGNLFNTVTSVFQSTGCTPISPSSSPSSAPSDVPSYSPSVNAPTVSSRPSYSPSVSIGPSLAPSSEPSMAFAQKVYLGFHMEGGIIFDAGFTWLFPSPDTTSDPDTNEEFFRWCLGAELGGGAEMSLIVLVSNLREDCDITGVAFLAEFFEFGFGPHFGFGIGVFTEGIASSDDASAIHYEVTIGGGLGIGLAGGAGCSIEPEGKSCKSTKKTKKSTGKSKKFDEEWLDYDEDGEDDEY